MEKSNVSNNLKIRIAVFSAISCFTLSNYQLDNPSNYAMENSIMPSQNFTLGENAVIENYSINKNTVSNETSFQNKNVEDFKVIRSFANKMLADAPEIDKDIQKVINDNFWDML